MATVPYTNQAVANWPSSFDTARQDDFFGFGNAMQAIDSITPKQTHHDGTVQQPMQIVTVSGGTISPEMALESSGGTFFDLRSLDEIFADMDVRLNRQRQQVFNSPHLWKMLEKKDWVEKHFLDFISMHSEDVWLRNKYQNELVQWFH